MPPEKKSSLSNGRVEPEGRLLKETWHSINTLQMTLFSMREMDPFSLAFSSAPLTTLHV